MDWTQQPSERARPSPTIRIGVLGLFAGQVARAKLTVKLTDLAGNSETEKLRMRLKR